MYGDQTLTQFVKKRFFVDTMYRGEGSSVRDQMHLINIKVSSHLEVMFKEPPQSCQDLFRRLELIKDKYSGYFDNKRLVFFLYGCSGYVLSFDSNQLDYQVYKGNVSGVFSVRVAGGLPSFPLRYDVLLEDSIIDASCLITYKLSVEGSQISPSSLVDYLILNGPRKYRKKNSVKYSLFDSFLSKVKEDEKIIEIY
nr:hypothetical protein [Enontekio ohlsrhavirus]